MKYLLLFITLISGCSMHMYSWTDKEGNKHYYANSYVDDAKYDDGATMSRTEPQKIFDNVPIKNIE